MFASSYSHVTLLETGAYRYFIILYSTLGPAAMAMGLYIMLAWVVAGTRTKTAIRLPLQTLVFDPRRVVISS